MAKKTVDLALLRELAKKDPQAFLEHAPFLLMQSKLTRKELPLVEALFIKVAQDRPSLAVEKYENYMQFPFAQKVFEAARRCVSDPLKANEILQKKMVEKMLFVESLKRPDAQVIRGSAGVNGHSHVDTVKVRQSKQPAEMMV